MAEHSYIPPQLWEQILQQMMLPPEWSMSKQSYQPLDSGYYEDQLDYQQNMLKMSMDPLVGFLSGGANFGSLQDTERVVDGGSTAGADYLNSVIARSGENTIERLIAEHILGGGSPIEAVQLASTAGLIPTVKDEKTGQSVPDPKLDEYYTNFATSAYDKLLSDRAPTTERVPNETIQRFLDAGFSDPRQAYTPEYIDQSYGMGVGQARDRSAKAQSAYDAAAAAFAAPMVSAARPVGPIMAPAPRGYGGPTPGSGGVGGGGGGGGSAASGGRRVLPPIDVTDAILKIGRPVSAGPPSEALARKAKLGKAKNEAYYGKVGAEASVKGAESRARAMAQYLSQQGRTPFSDEIAARFGIRV